MISSEGGQGSVVIIYPEKCQAGQASRDFPNGPFFETFPVKPGKFRNHLCHHLSTTTETTNGVFLPPTKVLAAWWYTYPSEKMIEFVNGFRMTTRI